MSTARYNSEFTLPTVEDWGNCVPRCSSMPQPERLGHSKVEITVQYLGIELDDALETAERTELLCEWPLTALKRRFRLESGSGL